MPEKRHQDRGSPHPIEWTVGVASAILVAGLISMTAYEAFTNADTPPQLAVARLVAAPGQPENQVRFEIVKSADTTAAGVLVHGEIRNENGVVETAEATFDYVPAQSKAAGALIFLSAIKGKELTIHAAGYADP